MLVIFLDTSHAQGKHVKQPQKIKTSGCHNRYLGLNPYDKEDIVHVVEGIVRTGSLDRIVWCFYISIRRLISSISDVGPGGNIRERKVFYFCVYK